MTTRQLNIKNRSYYFYNDLISVLGFEANNLKSHTKKIIGFRHFYISYVDKKPDGNLDNVNPLYLMINRVYGTISENNGNKYLTIDNIDKNDDVLKKYDQVFAGIKYHINNVDGSEVFMKTTT